MSTEVASERIGIPATRSKIVEAASELFYAEGIQAVPVERIIDHARVTRSTFYRYFTTKDDLVVAYLRYRDEQIRSDLEAAANHAESVEELLNVVIAAIGDELCGPGFRGCPFINAAAEYPNAASPVREVIESHRTWFIGALRDLLERAGHHSPSLAARSLAMIRDGAMVGGSLGDPGQTRDALAWAAEQVLHH